MGTQEKRVKTVDTAFRIIKILWSVGPLTPQEIEDRVELATSSVYRHLATLEENGYVIQKDNSYRLSFKFLTVGSDLRRQVAAYPMIKQKVDELAAESDERAQFIVRETTERVYLYTEIGENPVQTGAQTGKRGPLYSSAAGKSILAHLSGDTREELIRSFEWEPTGPETTTDPDELRDSLAEIRDRGYAFNLEETTRGVHAIGAPVLGPDEEVIGALSVAGPATRLRIDRLKGDLLDNLLATTNELELHIEHGQID
jgi:DNA-binding IclR family transcriptional regulator